MSVEDGETLDNPVPNQEDFTLLEDVKEDQGEVLGEVLECLSVMVNDQDPQQTQIEGLILDDHPLLGTTLTAITLPDGTQAFVTSNVDSDESEFKQDGNDNSRYQHQIVIREVSAIDSKTHMNIESIEYAPSQPGTSKETENYYSQIEYIDGNAYMVTNRVDADESLWELQNGKLVKTKTKLDEKPRYPCPREGCEKVYTTPHHLKVHERSHTGQRPYQCEHAKCKKNFSTAYSLKAHLRTHTGEKPYKCTTESCNKGFKTSGDLLKHVRTHTGERPFMCPYEGCNRSFTTSNIRKVHVRTHTGEKPYKCEICSKAFASATNYKNHIRIHSGEKPYACSVENCLKRFTEYSSLYKHHLVHTQQKPFECKLCNKRYRQKSTLLMHERTAHAFIAGIDGDEEETEEGEVNYFLETTLATQGKAKRQISNQNWVSVNEDGQLQFSETTGDSDNTGTQILFVGDPSQIAALQQMGLEESFDDSTIDTTLEGLNIKIDDMETFEWN